MTNNTAGRESTPPPGKPIEQDIVNTHVCSSLRAKREHHNPCPRPQGRLNPGGAIIRPRVIPLMRHAFLPVRKRSRYLFLGNYRLPRQYHNKRERSEFSIFKTGAKEIGVPFNPCMPESPCTSPPYQLRYSKKNEYKK